MSLCGCGVAIEKWLFHSTKKVTRCEMLFDRKLAKLYNNFSLLSKNEIHLTTKAVNHLDRATADLQPLVCI